MLIHSIIFLLGLGILYLGAEWLVQGSSDLAKRFGIRPLVIGLTIVALGTSLPEFLLNFFAVMMEEDGLAIGNIIGSNISNIALILGVSAIVMPLTFDDFALKKEYPMMLATTGLFYILALDGMISRIDGGILLSGLLAFMVYIVRDALAHARNGNRQDSAAAMVECEPSTPDQESNGFTMKRLRAIMDDPKMAPYFRVLLILAGMAALAVGARLMVDSAVGIASILEIAPILIGLTIVAIGTSLPELAASLMCAFKGEADMSVGNILGSNMFNILFVVGFVALIRPMEIEPVTITQHFPVLIGFSILLYPLARRKHNLSRVDGSILLVAFLTYLIWLIYPHL